MVNNCLKTGWGKGIRHEIKAAARGEFLRISDSILINLINFWNRYWFRSKISIKKLILPNWSISSLFLNSNFVLQCSANSFLTTIKFFPNFLIGRFFCQTLYEFFYSRVYNGKFYSNPWIRTIVKYSSSWNHRYFTCCCS